MISGSLYLRQTLISVPQYVRLRPYNLVIELMLTVQITESFACEPKRFWLWMEIFLLLFRQRERETASRRRLKRKRDGATEAKKPVGILDKRKWVSISKAEIYYRQLNFGKQNPLLSQFTYLLWLRPMLVFGTPVVFFLLLFEREKRLCKYRWLSVWFNWHGKNVDNGIRFWEKQTDYACMTTDECVHSGCGWGVRTTNPLQCECHAMQD